MKPDALFFVYELNLYLNNINNNISTVPSAYSSKNRVANNNQETFIPR
jgi:hypothetical protein